MALQTPVLRFDDMQYGSPQSDIIQITAPWRRIMKGGRRMQYDSMDELLAQLRGILRSNGSARTYRTAFVLLPDACAWREVLALLRAESVGTLNLSRLCTSNGRLPAPLRLLRLISESEGNVALLPASMLLRAGPYPERIRLFDRLAKLKRTCGTLVVPLMACSDELARVLPDAAPARLLELRGIERPVRACFCAPALPCSGMSLTEWLAALETGLPPANAYVKVPAPLRFAGNGIRVLTSCYALLSARLSGLEFMADERLLCEAAWRELYIALSSQAFSSARAAFEHCAELELRGQLQPGDPRRHAAWIARLNGLRAGAYTRRILAVQSEYATLEDAVALELLAGTDPNRAKAAGALAPERMSAGEWLDIRAERGAMLRALGIRRLPSRYWHMLERVPERRKLMYSSLCTPDERNFCKRYLLKYTDDANRQLEHRSDVRLMYPELIDELKQMASSGSR